MTLKEQIESMKAEIEELEGKRDKKKAEFDAATTELQRAKYHVQLGKLVAKIADKVAALKSLQIKLQLEEIALQREALADREQTLLDQQVLVGDKKTLQRIIDAAHTVLNLGATRLIIAKQEREFVSFLRRVVVHNPTGWTSHEDPAKRYKFFRTSRLVIVLQDSPSYDITFEDLVYWLGMATARQFATVDTTKLANTIEMGTVLARGADGDIHIATMEEWYQKRTRSVGEPKVKVMEEDVVGREQVLIVKPELLSMPIDELANLTDLTGHELNPLRAEGVQKIGQIRGFSGDQLMSITGIGRVRAMKIMDAISELSTGTPEEVVAKSSDEEDPEA